MRSGDDAIDNQFRLAMHLIWSTKFVQGLLRFGVLMGDRETLRRKCKNFIRMKCITLVGLSRPSHLLGKMVPVKHNRRKSFELCDNDQDNEHA